MIAEIFGKISRTGSNLSDRLEDKLTGDVFGTLRYLPYEAGLGHLLAAVRFENQSIQQQWNQLVSNQTGYAYDLTFWPAHIEGEIDLMLRLDDSVIGIEVKYHSWLSSDDEDPTIEMKDSKNQLVRYARMLSSMVDEKQRFLVFLAPQETVAGVSSLMSQRTVIPGNVLLGYLCWEDVLQAFKTIQDDQMEYGQRLMIQDLRDLLTKKGFERFTGFIEGIEGVSVSTDAYVFADKQRPHVVQFQWPKVQIQAEDYYEFK